jgi:hypothetical protein
VASETNAALAATTVPPARKARRESSGPLMANALLHAEFFA